MPCGGIYFGGPLYPEVWTGECLWCHQGNADHFCDEWDAFIHAECVVPFLASKTDESEVILNHAHTIVIILDQKERTRLLQEAQRQKKRHDRRKRVRA